MTYTCKTSAYAMKRKCIRIFWRTAVLICLITLMYSVKWVLFESHGVALPWDVTEHDMKRNSLNIYRSKTIGIGTVVQGINALHKAELLNNLHRSQISLHGLETKRNVQNQSKEIDTQKEADDLFDLWNNWTYPPFVVSNPPDGPGEYGNDVEFNEKKLSPEEKQLYDEGMANHKYNQFVGDKVSVRRRLTDFRNRNCTKKIYGKDLPEASVIIIFHNEAWTSLLRSVHSVIDRSPPHLLREVILVDDFSVYDYLKGPLEKYMKTLGKVKILRLPQRGGLTKARLFGYAAATAPVLIFLDSHIECLQGWLEPLLDRINDNPHIVPFPKIDFINQNTFGVRKSHNAAGAFDWSFLTFSWAAYNSLSNFDVTPFRSATMPGGLFAINREYFTKLGAYDPGLDYWGSENMELSFKVWMCNGSIEVVPCSHVAHLFRSDSPILWPQIKDDPLKRNALRVAEVWMDEYKLYIFEQFNFNLGDMGDLTERKKLRASLHCKSFDWYMKNILPDKYIPDDVLYAGDIRNVASGLCLDSMEKNKKPELYQCHNQGYHQFWYFTENGRISQAEEFCLRVKGKRIRKEHSCQHERTWEYRKDKSLFNPDTKLCLQANKNATLTLNPCIRTNWQRWHLTPRRPLHSV